jgi:hypothetical protein
MWLRPQSILLITLHSELGFVMKNGLYSITTKGFDGVDWPPGGVCVLCTEGTLKGECVINPHTPPPAGHLYFNAKDIGVGFAGTYEGDQAELTATVVVGTRSLSLQLTLRKLADL